MLYGQGTDLDFLGTALKARHILSKATLRKKPKIRLVF